MFEKLQERLESTFKKLRGYGKLSEDNIKDTLREVRVALLEADVNYKVAKDFLEKVKEKAMGEDVVTSITPGQQFIKVVYDELCALLGSTNKPLDVAGSPPVAVMLDRPSGFRQDNNLRQACPPSEKERDAGRCLCLPISTDLPL